MDVLKTIGQLEALGINLTLAIDYEGVITPEADALLNELSDNREVAVDFLAGRRFAPLSDNTPIPSQFRSQRMNEIRAIFATLYKMLEKFEGITAHEDWKKAANYYNGRLDEHDVLAISMYTICYEELSRQYRKLTQ